MHLETLFPVKKLKMTNKKFPRKPWITPGLIKLCNKKQKLYKCFVSDPSEQNKSKYKLYRNKLKVLLNKAETTYYKEKFDLYKSDIKQGPDLQNIIRQSYDKVMTMTEVMTNHTTDAIYKKLYDKVMINL